jgi:hypothetical protein
MLNLMIKGATVLLTCGPDKIILQTDLPCPYAPGYMPKQPPLSVSFDATYDTGVEYVIEVFGIDHPEVINTRPE